MRTLRGMVLMPIRPENRSRYPADWPQISLAIKERAGWRCECRGECGLDHPLGVYPNGERCCRACKRDWQREHRRRTADA